MAKGSAMLENAPPKEKEEPTSAKKPAKEKKPKTPPGTVERKLNFKERTLILGAVASCCGQQKGDWKAIHRYERLKKILRMDEANEYFEMIEDSYSMEENEWQDSLKEWMTTPPAKRGKRPRRPEVKEKDIRGRERAFYIPSKLDVVIQDAIKENKNWAPSDSEYIVELCEKFGFKVEEEG